VRHDETAGGEGKVGIFFAHRTFQSSRGEDHLLCTLSFNGRVDARLTNPNSKGNTVPLLVERLWEPLRGGVLNPAGESVDLPVSWSERSVERKLAVEVSPKMIRFTVWRDPQFGAESESKEVTFEAIERARNDESMILPTDDASIPRLDFRGSLGLYVRKGFASFRNTVIKSRGESTSQRPLEDSLP
jgi:hypothetical protein